jgi:hypothetical protein
MRDAACCPFRQDPIHLPCFQIPYPVGPVPFSRNEPRLCSRQATALPVPARYVQARRSHLPIVPSTRKAHTLHRVLPQLADRDRVPQWSLAGRHRRLSDRRPPQALPSAPDVHRQVDDEGEPGDGVPPAERPGYRQLDRHAAVRKSSSRSEAARRMARSAIVRAWTVRVAIRARARGRWARCTATSATKTRPTSVWMAIRTCRRSSVPSAAAAEPRRPRWTAQRERERRAVWSSADCLSGVPACGSSGASGIRHLPESVRKASRGSRAAR